jgi:hypothetical protein
MFGRLLVGALIAAGIAGHARTQTCAAYPNVLTNGTTADANQVMANFNSIQSCANASLAPLASPHLTGNVTIGTPASGYALDTAGIGRFQSANLGSTGAIIIRDAPGNPQAGYIQFVNNADSAQLGFILGLNSSGLDLGGGNVGIGMTTPYALLDLGTAVTTVKLALYESGGGNVYGIGVNAGALTFGAGLASVTATPQMVFAAPGYLGIGTTSPGQALYVVGTAGGNNQWSVTSDSRLKKNVREITGALGLVERIRGVRYDWRTPGERQIGKALNLPVGQPQVGFVAQELKTVMPEAVNVPQNPSEQPYSIKEGDLVPVLVEAVKEQQAEIEQLRAELAAMKGAR